MTTTQVAITRRSGDRKVSPTIRRQGSKDAPALLNAYGLPAGLSCPDRTEFCKSCYAEATEQMYTSVSALMLANWEAHSAADTVKHHENILTVMIDGYQAEFIKLKNKGRAVDRENIFRIHWDGDMFSRNYAQAWANCIGKYPQTQFWVYTRSFRWAHLFAGIDNIAVYLSVDEYNVDIARGVLKSHPWLHVAFCAETQAAAAHLATRLGRKSVPCPENVKRIPLVMHKSGRRSQTVEVGTDGQGACAACRLCVDGVRDVGFAIKGR